MIYENTLPSWILESRLNPEVPLCYFSKCGDFEKYKSDFFDYHNGVFWAKSEYLDYVKKVPMEKVYISFQMINDASITGKRYQEGMVCQTPLMYSYEDLFNLFKENVPKIRQRNASRTYLEPLIPCDCGKYIILKALIESDMIEGHKEIVLAITSDSIKISYTTKKHNYSDSKRILDNERIKVDYFNMTCNEDYLELSAKFKSYVAINRTKIRTSYYGMRQVIEILYNVRKNTFKKYRSFLDDSKLLTKADHDIYYFIANRGSASPGLIAKEFGYSSSRAAKYHLDKLIGMKIIEKVGEDKSPQTVYKIKKQH